jgi:hypothetical protein
MTALENADVASCASDMPKSPPCGGVVDEGRFYHGWRRKKAANPWGDAA